MTALHFTTALLGQDWADDVRLTVDEAGLIASIETGTPAQPGDTVIKGTALPGMANLHSHAFQRAMAGLTEIAGPSDDSFWTWREVMYGFVGKLMPEHIEIIAAKLYLEMLKAGYTSVAEFHYLHHAPDGASYDQLTEMSDRVIGAARHVGLGITHLPVLYAYGGFGAAEPSAGQARFLNNADRYLTLLRTLHDQYKDELGVRVGIAPHSLRAVTGELLSEVLEGAKFLGDDFPIHIHIAEQTREVEEAMTFLYARPVEWLLDRMAVDKRWCLVHATHLTSAEVHGIAGSGAVAGLCPTTEANLGDGLFPMGPFQKAHGAFGIGTDSNTEVSVAGELRLLEYGQRLAARARNIVSRGAGHSTGQTLYTRAAKGGAQALGIPGGMLAEGARADITVLDDAHPAAAGRGKAQLLDTWIFGGIPDLVSDVFVGGAHVIRNHAHEHESDIDHKFSELMRNLAT